MGILDGIFGAKPKAPPKELGEISKRQHDIANMGYDKMMSGNDIVQRFMEDILNNIGRYQEIASDYGNFLRGAGQLSEGTYRDFYEPFERQYAERIALAGSPEQVELQRQRAKSYIEAGISNQRQRMNQNNALRGQTGLVASNTSAAQEAAIAAEIASAQNAAIEQERRYGDVLKQQGATAANNMLGRAQSFYGQELANQQNMAQVPTVLTSAAQILDAQPYKDLSEQTTNIYGEAYNSIGNTHAAQEAYRQAKAARKGAIIGTAIDAVGMAFGVPPGLGSSIVSGSGGKSAFGGFSGFGGDAKDSGGGDGGYSGSDFRDFLIKSGYSGSRIG